jgi:hypothetical protein
MKSRKTWKVLLRLVSLVAILVLAIGVSVPGASAATPDEINQAIEDGLAWLAGHQNPNGSWGSVNTVGRTGLAVLKFETHATFMGLSPLDPAYVYSPNVMNGLNYLFNMCNEVAIPPEPAGDPDTNGNGIGVRCYHQRITYETSIALMAISASNAPGEMVTVGTQAGRSYAAVAQDMVDWLAWAQVDPNYGNYRGGWRYNGDDANADNSVSGYASIGLIYAEAPAPWGFSLTVPAFVFSEMNFWIDYIQTDQLGGTTDGGSGYTDPNNWVNTLKTGNLLSEMGLYGDTQATARVQYAVDYMERVWNDTNSNYEPGWKGPVGGHPDYQSCFTIMKGFQALGIEEIDTGAGPFSWYEDMADAIVTTQNPDGSWPATEYGDQQLSTCWAMLTLEKAAPPALSLLPPFDINPPGSDHTVTAVYKLAGVPQAGVQINFEVIAGPNAGESGSAITNASGEATFTYTGTGGPGTDTIRATAVDDTGTPLISSQAQKEWQDGAPPQEVPGVTGWGIIAATLIIAALIPLGLRRRQQTNKAR